MLQHYINISVVATLICSRCGDIYEFCDSTEESAERNLVTDAIQEGWRAIDGCVVCGDCQGKY